MELRPVMWTGELSLKSIRTFLEGYSCALHDHNLITSNHKEGLNFHDWVAHKLGLSSSSAGWQNMILAITLGLDPNTVSWENYDAEVTKEQHERSIRMFYELLEEYITE